MFRVVVERTSGELPDVPEVRAGYRGGELVELVGEHRLEQGLLVAEVLVQTFLVDPGPLGDTGHGRAVRPALGELGRRRLFEPSPGALGVPGHGPTVDQSNDNVAVATETS